MREAGGDARGREAMQMRAELETKNARLRVSKTGILVKRRPVMTYSPTGLPRQYHPRGEA